MTDLTYNLLYGQGWPEVPRSIFLSPLEIKDICHYAVKEHIFLEKEMINFSHLRYSVNF